MRGDVLFPVRRALLDAQPAEPKAPPRAPRIFNGPKPRATVRAAQPGSLPDWVVLEVRRLRESDGMMPKQIAVHMAGLGVDIETTQIHAIVYYTSRAHLVPAHRRREPYGPEAT